MTQEEERVKIIFDTNASKAAAESNKLAGALDKVDDSADSAGKSMKSLDSTFDEVYEGMKPLTARMGEAEDRLYELALAGDTASKEYQGLLEKVAQYRKTQIETDRVVDAAATTLGQKLGGAAQIAATGVQGVTAGMALFGDQSEETEKALLKVQAAMAFADAISNVSTLGGQWRVLKSSIVESSIATKANTAATGAAAMVQRLFTGGVATTTVGFKALKFAIAATGIGLLIVGLGLVVSNFDKIKKVVLNVVPGLAAVGETIGNIINSITDFIGVTSEADRAIERIKQNADQSLALNKKFLEEHGDQLNEFTKQKIDAKNRYNEAVKEDGADQIALAKRLNRELAAIEYSRGDEAREIQKQNAEKAAEEAEKRRLKNIEDEVKRKEKAKKEAEDLAASEAEAEKETLESIEEADKEKQKEREEKDAEDAAMRVRQLEAFADAEVAVEKAKAEQKKAIQDGQLQVADAAVGFLSRIAGKNKTLQKAAIIAESALGIGKSIIANNTANVAALATPQAIATSGAAAAPVIAFNNISTGLGVAGNIAATAKALQALGGGSSPSGGGTSTSGGVRGSAPPTVAFNNTAENQIGQSVVKTQSDQPPLKVFVAESDISKAQNNVKVLVDKNVF